MARQRNEQHVKQVEAWKRLNGGVSAKELPQLFINGILAIRRKSLVTLSNITVTAVIDRILLECKERYPVLSAITSDSEGLHFNKFYDHMMDLKPEEVQEALQELLIELLDVFGKITADILTKNLHQELMTVTAQPSLKGLEPKAALSLGLARKNRDQNEG